MKIAIIGCGPRGLSVALYLNKYIKDLCLDIYDPEPLKTWTYPNLLDKLRMRSSVRFDLVTNDPDMTEFSFSRFLNLNLGAKPVEQSTLESLNHPVDRKQFIAYLDHIYKYLVSRGISIIKEKATSITAKSVNNIPYDYVILAVGSQSKNKYPKWLLDNDIAQLVKEYKDTHFIKNTNVLIVGSGQSAAEYVEFLEPNNTIHWLRNKEIKIHPYPVPSYMEWKGNTALGKYYLTLPNDSTKSAYIQAVKEWGPTILPSTFNSIKHKNINYISYSASSEIKRYIEDNKIEAIVVSIGSNADITKIPIYKSVDMSPIISNVPKLYKEFKMSNGLYVTGTLAVDYGGPRQGSLVSTGDTSRAILNDIKENANI